MTCNTRHSEQTPPVASELNVYRRRGRSPVARSVGTIDSVWLIGHHGGPLAPEVGRLTLTRQMGKCFMFRPEWG